MKALVYEGPKSMVYRDFDAPVAGNDVSIVQMAAVGICGSDMHAYLGHDERRPPPLILGHEAAGVVVDGPLTGKRVTVNPLVACGDCGYCRAGQNHLCQSRQMISMAPRQGAFAELIAVPPDNLVEIPDGVAQEIAALAEPMAVCWHAAKLGERLMTGSLSDAAVLILGGGAIGLGSALAMAARGATDISIVEPNDLRRENLQSTGPWCLIAAASDAPAGKFDLVIDAVGYGGTRADASTAARAGGVIVHLGLGNAAEGLDVRRLTLQEISFAGSYCYTPEDFRETAQAIFDGRFGPLDWTEKRALSDGHAAFDDILNGRVAAPKIILHP